MLEEIQNVASSKGALVTVGGGTALMPWWVQFLNGEIAQAIVMILGMLVAISVIAVNIQTIIKIRKNLGDDK